MPAIRPPDPRVLFAFTVAVLLANWPVASALPSLHKAHKYGHSAQVDSINTTLPGLGLREDNITNAELVSKVGRRLASIQESLRSLEELFGPILALVNASGPAPGHRRLLQATLENATAPEPWLEENDRYIRITHDNTTAPERRKLAEDEPYIQVLLNATVEEAAANSSIYDLLASAFLPTSKTTP